MDRLGIRELLRYGYTGFLCLIIAVAVDDTKIGHLVTTLGDVLAPLAVVAIGAAVYLVFKTLVGDLFLWRVLHWIHMKTDHFCRREEPQCKIAYLVGHYNVPPRFGSRAFVLVRDKLLLEAERERFHIQHSEAYIIWITAVLCGLVSVTAMFGLLPTVSLPKSVVFGGVAVLASLAGIAQETSICRAERSAIGVLSPQAVTTVLRGGGLLPVRDVHDTQTEESTAP